MIFVSAPSKPNRRPRGSFDMEFDRAEKFRNTANVLVIEKHSRCSVARSKADPPILTGLGVERNKCARLGGCLGVESCPRVGRFASGWNQFLCPLSIRAGSTECLDGQSRGGGASRARDAVHPYIELLADRTW